MNKKIAIVGGLGLDTNIYTQEKILDPSIETHFQTILDTVGGTAGYSSLSYASLGYSPYIIDFIGHDLAGNYITDILRQSGVNLSGVMTSQVGTKRSVNLVYPNGTRNSFYDGKDSIMVRPEDIDMEQVSEIFLSTDYAHFSIVNWTRFLLDEAIRCNNTIIVDLQDIWKVNDEYRRDYIQKADVIFFSASNLDDIPSVLREMSSYNNKAIIIATNGVKGSQVLHPDGNEIQDFEISRRNWEVIDTNGAGDCFAVGFVTSYFHRGLSVSKAVDRANINAFHICTQRGPETRFLTKKELDSHSAKSF